MPTKKTPTTKYVMKSCVNVRLHIKKGKLLEEGQGLTLARNLEIAENFEKVDSQLAAMKLNGKGEGAMSVNRIDETKSDSRDRKQSTGATGNSREQTCYRCGRFGHFGRDPGCPAKGKTCRKCGLKDHFEPSARQEQSKARRDKDRPAATGIVIETQQTWSTQTKRKTRFMHLQLMIRNKKKSKLLSAVAS